MHGLRRVRYGVPQKNNQSHSGDGKSLRGVLEHLARKRSKVGLRKRLYSLRNLREEMPRRRDKGFEQLGYDRLRQMHGLYGLPRRVPEQVYSRIQIRRRA